MNLRERKKARTRRVLGEAAIRLFEAQGFDATPIDEIVAAAGVSRRTFFRYFPSKEAAFFIHQANRLETFAALSDAYRPHQGVWGAVRTSLLDIAVVYQSDPRGSLTWHHTLMSSTHLIAYDLQSDLAWENLIRDQFVEAGWSPLRAAASAGAVMGVVRASLRTWYAQGAETDLPTLGREGFKLLERGLLT